MVQNRIVKTTKWEIIGCYKYCLHHGITIHPEHTLTLLRFYNPYQELDFFCVRILDVPPCCLKNTFTGLDEEGFI